MWSAIAHVINQFVDHLLHITFLHRTLKTIIDPKIVVVLLHILYRRGRSPRIKERSDAIAPKGAVGVAEIRS